MPLRLRALADRLHESLWLIPSGGIVLAFAVQWLLSRIDEHLSRESARWFVFGGGAESARGFLSTIATGMLSMTALAFTVTMLVLQLASSQLSPRVVTTFLRDRHNQGVLALFISTYTYTLLTLREVRADFVPGVTVWAAFVLMMLSIGAFVYFIHHIAQSIRPPSVIGRVGSDTRRELEHLYPEALATDASAVDDAPALPEGAPTATYRWPGSSGVLIGVDEERLLSLCLEHGCFLRLIPMMGDFVGHGAHVGSAWGDSTPEEQELYRALVLAPERTLRQDALYGVRQLVDIAERALSPGTNDPTTALEVLNELHSLLIELSEREIPSPLRLTEDGRPLMHLPRPDWPAYVSLALDEIRHYGHGSIQIVRRIRYLLEDLLSRVGPTRAPVLEDELAQLDAVIDETFSGRDRALAGLADAQGHGPVREAPRA